MSVSQWLIRWWYRLIGGNPDSYCAVCGQRPPFSKDSYCHGRNRR